MAEAKKTSACALEDIPDAASSICLIAEDDPFAELKRSWVLAGEPLEDFTPSNYRKKLREQERADFKLNFIKGETNYEDKIEALRRISVQRKFIRAVVLAPLKLPLIIGNDLAWLGKGVGTAMEPRYRKRARLRRTLLGRIDEHEAKALSIAREISAIRRKRADTLVEENRINHERGLLIEHGKTSDDLKRRLENEERETKRQLEIEQFREKRRRNLAELRASRAAMDAKAEREKAEYEKARRHWRTAYYGRVAVEALSEARERQAESAAHYDRKDALLAALHGCEFAQRDITAAAEQTEGPAVNEVITLPASKRSLGVFGGELPTTPDKEAKFFADPKLTLFSGRPAEMHEQAWMDLNQLESTLGRAKTDCDAYNQTEVDATAQASALELQRTRLGIERAQLHAEHELLVNKIAGPPRREPTSAEKDATHRRQTRMASLARRETELEHKVSLLRQRATAAAVSKTRTEGRVAALTECCGKLRSRLEAHRGGVGEPPIVVGRAIALSSFTSKDNTGGNNGITGDTMQLHSETLSATQAQPLEMYRAIRANTKLELAHSEANIILSSRQNIRTLERHIWARELERSHDRADLDSIFTRLSNIAQRVKHARAEDARDDLQKAVQLWWARGEQLQPVHVRHDGPINWWAHRVKSLCSGVEQWRSSDLFDCMGNTAQQSHAQGVLAASNATSSSHCAQNEAPFVVENIQSQSDLPHADGDERPNLQGVAHAAGISGVLAGEMSLPKLDLYAIELVVTKRDPDSADLGDRTDRCTVKLGPSLRQLSVVAVVNNIIDEYSGAVRFEIAYTLRAAKVAWQFEFMSSTAVPDTHFVVEQGAYGPKDIPPLETFGESNRVLSSFVKQLRYQQSQGHTKYATCLAELIRAENHRDNARMTHDEAAVRKRRLAKQDVTMSKNTPEQLPSPEGKWWDSKALHGTAQRYPIDSFCKLMRNELQIAAAATVSDTRGELSSTPPALKARGGRLSPAQRSDATSTKTVAAEREESRMKRVRASAAHYTARKRALWQPKIAEAEQLVDGTLEIFDEEKQLWVHARIQAVEVTWYDNGTRPAIRHRILPVDDLERVIGSSKWVDMSKVRSFASRRIEADLETRAIWEANEAAEAAACAQALLAQIAVEKRTKVRQAKEAAEFERFERVRSEAIARKRGNAEVEASSILETKPVLLVVTRMARHVIEELRAGLIAPAEIGLNFADNSKNSNKVEMIDSTDLAVAFTSFTNVNSVAAALQEENASIKNDDDNSEHVLEEDAQKKSSLSNSPKNSKLKFSTTFTAGFEAVTTFFNRFLFDGPENAARDLKPLPILAATPAAAARRRRQKKLKLAALTEAKRRWVREYVEAATAAEERKWEAAAQQRQADTAAAMKAEQIALEKAAKKSELKELARERERADQRRQRRAATRRKIGLIPDFFKGAVCNAVNCEHRRSKGWGDRYGKGIRCLDCGKELTTTHLDEDQQNGIGYGDNRETCERVRRHRFNRAAYRAESEDMAAEVASVEAERLRLEKERYALRAVEPHFYDFDDMRVVYEFDRRHKRRLKDDGVVRQGVQWSQEEAEARALDIERGRRENGECWTQDSQQAAALAVDKFQLDARLLTTRNEERRRRAAFHDLLLVAARINKFRMRLRELDKQRKVIHVERKVLDAVLCFLHREVFQIEVKLKRVSDDLTRTAVVLGIRWKAQQQADNTAKLLEQAKHDYKEAELELVGLAEDAENARLTSDTLAGTVRDLIRQRHRQESKLLAMQERAMSSRERADEAAVRLGKARDLLSSLHYRQRGVIVPTPYGQCRVVMYRHIDSVVVVQLSFGVPRARAYVPVDSIMQTERAIAASNLVVMRDEERQSRNYYKREAMLAWREQQAMRDDEISLRDTLAFEASVSEERSIIATRIEVAVERSRAFITSRKGRAEIARQVQRALERETRLREIAKRTWRGHGRRPRKMMWPERAKFRLFEFRRLRKQFLLEQARLAATDAQLAIDSRREARTAESTLEFVYLNFVRGFIVELADESLRDGVNARRRTEDETGIVLDAPAHTQYPVYNILSRWWVDKKRNLKKNLVSWGAHSVKGELQREEDRRRRQEMVVDIEAREKREKERKLQAEWGRRLHLEELANRRFYRDELKQCLAEYREMKREEAEMRLYMRQVALFEAKLAASKYSVSNFGGAAAVANTLTSKTLRRTQIKLQQVSRQQRQRELAAMAKEDQLSLQIRSEYQRLEQLKAMSVERELAKGFFSESESIVSSGDEYHSASSASSTDDNSGDDAESEPVQSMAQGNVDNENSAEARADRKRTRRQKRIAKARARAVSKREAVEKAAQAELEAERRDAEIGQATVELEWMEREEEARLAEKEVRVARENLRKVTLYCQCKGQEELRARAKATKLRDQCNVRTVNRNKAVSWLEACQANANDARRVNARVRDDTKYVDTRALTGVFQRFETSGLYAMLHTFYFRMLVYAIANRAELIATERRQFLLHEALQCNLAARENRRSALKDVLRKRIRDEFLRLRRSELGKKVFGRSQRAVIVDVFRRWVRFWMWHLGHRRAFELNFELLKQKLDMRRRYGTVLCSPRGDTLGKIAHTSLDAQPETHGIDSLVGLRFAKTRVEQFQHRPLQCVTCGCTYTEAHNHATACTYHPGQHKLSCPRSCPAFADARKISPACMGHRAKRWSCCDQRSKGGGCRTRFHLPPTAESKYGDVAKKLTEDIVAKKDALDDALAQIAAKKVVHSACQAHRVRLDSMAKELDNERSIVARFKSLRCDKTIREDAIVKVIKDRRQQLQADFQARYHLVDHTVSAHQKRPALTP